MSSANEHLPPPPKPRMSPLEFRNTDLVSRLLAATPPYLYNMSLLPNTYFFSEMLRSFVQAKAERASNSVTSTSTAPAINSRRSRKRAWSTNKSDCFVKPVSKEKQEHNTEWTLKNSRISEENPLELTISKENSIENESKNDNSVNFSPKIESFAKPEEQLFPQFPQSSGGQDSSSNLVLPPPPPIWYPPIYPTAPYGIDPLHFFIDLRVSGHIYDRKNHPKESSSFSTATTSKDADLSRFDEKSANLTDLKDILKQPRHVSAFSVPIPNGGKTALIKSNTNENRSTKFDVKSMGFDKSNNKTSTTYIMNNIKNIYQNITENKDEIKDDNGGEETEEEREKRVKDLRALIGLELVVDYMNHAKPGQQQNQTEQSNVTSHQSVESINSINSTDLESLGSPTLEVVDET